MTTATQETLSTLEETIREMLNGIVDPCSVAAGVPAGLVDMGLLLDLNVGHAADGHSVRVTLGTTDGRCLVTGLFLKEAQERLEQIPGVKSVTVALDASVIWTSARHSPAYRERLAAHRAGRAEAAARWRIAGSP